jgi:hypothetical protein
MGRRDTLLTLAEWEATRAREIMRRVNALLSLHRDHVERQERYLARAKENGPAYAEPKSKP